MANDEKLLEIVEKIISKPFEREFNKPIIKSEYNHKKELSKKAGADDINDILGWIDAGNESSFQVKGYLGRAKGLMTRGVEEGDVMHALNGARIYAKLNPKGEVPYSVKRRLTKALENESKRYGLADSFIKKDAEKVKKFITGHETKKSLEKAIFTTTIIGLIVGIFFLSPNLTGNAISNLTNQTSNIIGGGLFVIGIIGGLMWFKNR